MSRQGSRSGAITSPAGDRVRRKAAANGCENLLRAQLRTGAHWLSPGEFARACESVGLVPCAFARGVADAAAIPPPSTTKEPEHGRRSQ